MISIYGSAPRAYYKGSRDFQLIGRVLEALSNYLKMNVDLVGADPLSPNSDSAMLPLLAKTLGFESKHEYNTEDLRALCSCFARIVRKKGSMDGIVEAIKAFLAAKNIKYVANPTRNPSDYMDLQIYLPSEVEDTSLLEDVFDYILPAGMTFNFVSASKAPKPASSGIKAVGSAWHRVYSPSATGQVTGESNATRPDQVPASGRAGIDDMSSYQLGAVVGGRPDSNGGEQE